MKSNAPIILALDFPDIQSTQEMIEKTSHVISIYKLGLEFYLAQGKNGIAQINRSFPDIKRDERRFHRRSEDGD